MAKVDDYAAELAALKAECEALKAKLAQAAGELAVSKAKPAVGAVVKLRMPRILGGKSFPAGAVIGRFISHENVDLAAVETAMRSHKTEWEEEKV